jgi:hypothetical protein
LFSTTSRFVSPNRASSAHLQAAMPTRHPAPEGSAGLTRRFLAPTDALLLDDRPLLTLPCPRNHRDAKGSPFSIVSRVVPGSGKRWRGCGTGAFAGSTCRHWRPTMPARTPRHEIWPSLPCGGSSEVHPRARTVEQTTLRIRQCRREIELGFDIGQNPRRCRAGGGCQDNVGERCSRQLSSCARESRPRPPRPGRSSDR